MTTPAVNNPQSPNLASLNSSVIPLAKEKVTRDPLRMTVVIDRTPEAEAISANVGLIITKVNAPHPLPSSSLAAGKPIHPILPVENIFLGNGPDAPKPIIRRLADPTQNFNAKVEAIKEACRSIDSLIANGQIDSAKEKLNEASEALEEIDNLISDKDKNSNIMQQRDNMKMLIDQAKERIKQLPISASPGHSSLPIPSAEAAGPGHPRTVSAPGPSVATATPTPSSAEPARLAAASSAVSGRPASADASSMVASSSIPSATATPAPASVVSAPSAQPTPNAARGVVSAPLPKPQTTVHVVSTPAPGTTPPPVTTTVNSADFNRGFDEVRNKAIANKTSPSDEMVELYNKFKTQIAPTDFKVTAKLDEPYQCTRGVNKDGIAYFEVAYKQTVTIKNSGPPEITKDIQRKCFVATDDPAKAILIAKKYVEKQGEMVEATIDTTKKVDGFDPAKKGDLFNKAMFCSINKDGSGIFRLNTDTSSPGVSFSKTPKNKDLQKVFSDKTHYETEEEEILGKKIQVRTSVSDVDKNFDVPNYLKAMNERVKKQNEAAEANRKLFLESTGGRLDRAKEFIKGTQYAEPMASLRRDQQILQLQFMERMTEKVANLADKTQLSPALLKEIAEGSNRTFGYNILAKIATPGRFITKEDVLRIIHEKKKEIGNPGKEESALLRNHRTALTQYTRAKENVQSKEEAFYAKSKSFLQKYPQDLTADPQPNELVALNTEIQTAFGIPNKFPAGTKKEEINKFFNYMNVLQNHVLHLNNVPDLQFSQGELVTIQRRLAICGLPTGIVKDGLTVKTLQRLLGEHASKFIAGSELATAMDNLEKAEKSARTSEKDIKNRGQYLVNKLNEYQNNLRILYQSKAELVAVKDKVLNTPEFQGQDLEKEFEKQSKELDDAITKHAADISKIEAELAKFLPKTPLPTGMVGHDPNALGGQP